MTTCFVIQPFDSGEFDKRFEDVIEPAIEAAGLKAYRVDRDPKVEVPIEAIETGIRNAAICLADITTDNPNVWYELGYAFAAARPVVMVCLEKRASTGFPFDIQHRTVITYKTEAPRDFEILRKTLTDRIKALLDNAETIRQIVEAEPLATTEGLSQPELRVLAVLASETAIPDTWTGVWTLKHNVERSGLTSIGFAFGFKRLSDKGLIESIDEPDEHGESYSLTRLTSSGWDWMDQNESLFVLKKTASSKSDGLEDETPF